MLRVLFFLLLFSGPVCAQTDSTNSAITTFPAARATQYTAADTVAALHRLFRTRRAGGFTLIGLGAATQVVSPIIGLQASNCCGSYPGLYGFAGGLAIGFAIGLPLTIAGGKVIGNHSVATEKRAIALYQETGVVPSKFEKELMSGVFFKLNNL